MDKDTVVADIDNLSEAQKAIAKKVYDAAVDIGVDPELALATVWTESRFSDRKSPAGAIGIMQIMPKTAQAYGVDIKQLNHPDVNIGLGVKILKDNLDRHGGDKTLALIDYNAGPKASERFLKANKDLSVLPKETQNYLKTIGEHHDLTGEEKSPFDEPMPEEDNSPSPFGDTDMSIPPHLLESPEPEKTTLLQDVQNYVTNLPNVASGVAGAGIQGMVNNKLLNDELKKSQLRTAQSVENLQQQFNAAQEEPNMNRILQGRTEEGLTGRQRQSYNDITSGRAAQARQAEQVLGDLSKKGIVAPNFKAKIFSEAMPTESTPSGILYSGQRAPTIEQRRIIEEAERNKPALQRVKESIRAIPTSRIPTGLTKLGGFGMKPILGPLSTGFMASYASNELQKAERLEAEGDLLGSKIARLNAMASGIGAIPSTPFMPLNFLKGVGMVGSAGLTGVESARNTLFPYKSVVKP